MSGRMTSQQEIRSEALEQATRLVCKFLPPEHRISPKRVARTTTIEVVIAVADEFVKYIDAGHLTSKGDDNGE